MRPADCIEIAAQDYIDRHHDDTESWTIDVVIEDIRANGPCLGDGGVDATEWLDNVQQALATGELDRRTAEAYRWVLRADEDYVRAVFEREFAA